MARRRNGFLAKRASAAVVHDHVVPIYDVVAESGVCYFVMQYIAGESLQERVDRLGPLPAEDVLRIGAQTAAGLHAAHQQGLIHRDVKPGNVLLEDTVNRVMISDFGLARASDDASLTRSGTITGTPHYMSPEQARGQAIDARSDLFSLGSVIYFMCTGRSPFRAPQMMAVLNRICHEPYRAIEEINPNVPYELTKIVNRLLNKKPDGRFRSAEEVHEHLQKLLSDFQSGRLRPRRMVRQCGTLFAAQHGDGRHVPVGHGRGCGDGTEEQPFARGRRWAVGTSGRTIKTRRSPNQPGAVQVPRPSAGWFEHTGSRWSPWFIGRDAVHGINEHRRVVDGVLAAAAAENIVGNISSLSSFGEVLGKDFETVTATIESAERMSTQCQNTNAGGIHWQREVSVIESMLTRLENDLNDYECADDCEEDDVEHNLNP